MASNYSDEEVQSDGGESSHRREDGGRSQSQSAPPSSIPPSPARSRKGKEVESRDTSNFGSRAVSLGEGEDDEGEDEGERDGESGEEEEEDQPAELDENDQDPINSAMNSGPGTPGPSGSSARKVTAAQFAKRKETKVEIKKVGVFDVIDDEIVLEDDPRGDAKIDTDGVLQGGRQFKLYTFSSPTRSSPTKHFMLSIDAARAAGFRDSLYFFRRNPTIHKLACTQSEKDMLIDAGKLSSNLKSRAVTIVSARNVFKVFGAQFIVNGKYVFDDYYEDRSLEAGHKPGEPAYIETYDTGKGDTGTLAAAKSSTPAGSVGKGLNTLLGSHANKSVASSGFAKDEYNSSGSGGVNHAIFSASGLQPFAKTWDPVAKKARPAANLSVNNWMHEYAKSVAESNRKLAELRMMNLGQIKVSSIDIEEDEDESESDDEDELERQDRLGANGEASTSKMDLDSPRGDSSSKRRTERRYNPLRGAHDPETNIPHVYRSTQPTKSSTIQIDSRPRLYDEEEIQTLDREERVKRRKLEVDSAKTIGLATIEYVVEAGEAGQEEQLLPGQFDFRPAELKWGTDYV